MSDLLYTLTQGDAKVLVLCESSSSLNSLSRYNNSFLILGKDFNLESRWFRVVDIREYDYSEVKHLRGNVYYTNEERTICDMVKFKSNERYIYESLETYFIRHGNFDAVVEEAVVCEVKEELMEYISTLDEWMEEFYEH